MGKCGRPRGYRMSEEAKAKIAEAKRGKRRKISTRIKISKSCRRVGKPTISIERVLMTDLRTAHKIQRGKYINVYIPHLNGRKTGNWMRYHVALMEQKLMRKLKPGENIHHWGDPTNNSPIVLTLCKSMKQHIKLDKAKENLYKYLDKQQNM